MLFKFIGVGLLVAVAIVYYFFFAGMSSSGDTQYVYIDATTPSIPYTLNSAKCQRAMQ